MKTGINFLLTLMLMICLSMTGCFTPYDNDEEDDDEKETLVLLNELFNEVSVTDGVTETRFFTNDPKYWTQQGYTIWTMWGDTEEEPFTERTVDMHKSAGYQYAGYGMVICQGIREVSGKQDNTMLTVMVNNNREYAVGKVIGGKYESVIWWTHSDNLLTGVGSNNKITVSYEAGEFKLKINGTLTDEFHNDDVPSFYTGKNGYIVVISPTDHFPSGAVDVTFKEEK